MELFATPRSSKQLIVQNSDLDKVMNIDRRKGGTIVAKGQRSFFRSDKRTGREGRLHLQKL
jgi:hypothetical protein